MTGDRKEKLQSKRIESLEKRCERLTTECDKLRSERTAMEHELGIAREKIARVKDAESEFMKAITQARLVKEQYEQAYQQLMILKSRYNDEISGLIEQLKH